MSWKIETRFEMLADRPEWMLEKGPTENLVDRKFYHGTNVVLHPGDVIEARFASPFFVPYWDTEHNRPYAFATTSIDWATQFAKQATGDKTNKNHHGRGYVYQVAPVDPNWALAQGPVRENIDQIGSPPIKAEHWWTDEVYEETWEYNKDYSEYISPNGWRVIRLVKTIEPSASWETVQGFRRRPIPK